MTVTHVIPGRTRDLGGFSVARVLPSPELRMVGPFVFFDHLGPSDFAPTQGIDVRPHPHIGLATVTYLFEGGLTHRDSLGTAIDIEPGAVNWMTAGSGIAHSERTPSHLRAAGHRMHGIQSWVALPDEHAEHAPTFAHHPAATLPALDLPGARGTLIAGSAYGETSSVLALSPLFYAHLEADDGATIDLPDDHEECAAYVVTGTIEHDGQRYDEGQMLVFTPGSPARFTALGPVRVMLLGGAALGERHIFWNFVSSSLDRIEQAKDDWRAGRFPTVPGETEFIPLPADPPGVHAVSKGSPTS